MRRRALTRVLVNDFKKNGALSYRKRTWAAFADSREAYDYVADLAKKNPTWVITTVCS